MDAAAHLDVHTLGIIGLAVGVTIAFSFTLLSLALRGMAALHIWAAAFWLLTLAGLAEGYDENAGFLSAIVGSALIAVANAAMLIGIALHIGRPLRWQGPAGVVVIFLAVQAGFMLWPPAQAVEATVFGAKSIFWDAWMIGLLLFRAPRELRTSCAFTALVFVIDTFFYLARGAVSLFPETNSHAWIAQMLTTSNYLFGILCTFLLSTGFTLMLVQRLVHDLRRAAEVDGLTGLLNRTALVKESAPKMTVGRPHAALLFDLDNFKAVNDCWGHAGGDAVLKHFADIVRTGGLPERALFSRYGGEEFLLLLPEASAGGAALLAEALRLRIQNAPAHFDGGSIAFTTSVGVSTVVGPELHRLIEAADSALYRAKNAGRNRVEVA